MHSFPEHYTLFNDVPSSPPNADETEDFTNFSITEIKAAIPEPSTWALLGLGALVLTFVSRRLARA